VRQTEAFGLPRALERRSDERLARHDGGVLRFGQPRVLVHHAREQLGIEAAPIHADAHRLGITAREFDQRGELIVALGAAAHVAGVDPQLGKGLRAGRMLGKQAVAVVMEIPDERHVDSRLIEPFPDVRHRRRGFRIVDRDAHELRAGPREIRHLPYGRRDIRRIGVRHGLHHDRRVPADGDLTDLHRAALPAPRGTVVRIALHSRVNRATSILVWRPRSTGCSS
jgi:hypothetical protein